MDPGAAKALLAAAGDLEGCGVTLDCPNDRYINDEAICGTPRSSSRPTAAMP